MGKYTICILHIKYKPSNQHNKCMHVSLRVRPWYYFHRAIPIVCVFQFLCFQLIYWWFLYGNECQVMHNLKTYQVCFWSSQIFLDIFKHCMLIWHYLKLWADRQIKIKIWCIWFHTFFFSSSNRTSIWRDPLLTCLQQMLCCWVHWLLV